MEYAKKRARRLMLEDAKTALDDDVLKDGAWGDVNGAALGGHDDDGSLEGDTTAKVDGTRDGEVVELEDTRDAGDVVHEVGDLLEVCSELDQGGVTEAVGVDDELAVLEGVEVRLDEHEVGAGLDGQEAATGHVDSVSVLEVADGSTDGSLELDDGDVCLALLVGGDGLAIGDDLHLEAALFDNTLDGAEVHPDVVGVEVLELLDGLELVDVLLGHLGDFKQAGFTLVVDDGTTLDVGLGLVGEFHDVLGVVLDHVLEDAHVDDSTQVVGVGKEDDLDTAVEQLVEGARVHERLEDVSVARGVPVTDGGVVALGRWKKGVPEDTGISGLVEGDDVDVVALVLFDDGLGVIVGVEGVHEHQGHADVVGAVEVLDLSDGEVEEGHALADLDDGLWSHASHGGTQAAIELDDCELLEILDRGGLAQVVVLDHLVGLWRSNAVPGEDVALGLVVQVSAEEREEVVHLGLEPLLFGGILDGVAKGVEGVAHLRGRHVCRGALEGLSLLAYPYITCLLPSLTTVDHRRPS